MTRRQIKIKDPTEFLLNQGGEQDAPAEDPERVEPETEPVKEEIHSLPAEKEQPDRRNATDSAHRNGREQKSRRVLLQIEPSLYEKIRDMAYADGNSINGEIRKLIRTGLKETGHESEADNDKS